MSNERRLSRLYRAYARAAIAMDRPRQEAVGRALQRLSGQLRHYRGQGQS